ncbi:MATE family efflux transporter [uncultured Erythrobacter sp.]|uniref:MATE family efflux transporter n=1 Tax=uncultured Erythrobacter sp. TaxID=263913 RepID=UPI0026302721|nr:MATE family efflux transporter [uncultured Erythrobacter sp.]
MDQERIFDLTGSVVVLSAPNILLVIFQASLILVEVFYLAIIGDQFLVMLALITPVYMLMLMLGSGAISTASSSLVARYLGAEQYSQAKICAAQGVLLAIALGLAFFASVLILSPVLVLFLNDGLVALLPVGTYQYIAVLFLSAPAIFAYNALSGVMRGAGEMVFPAVVSAVTALLTVAIMPLVMFGFGPVEGIGFIGAAATLTSFTYLGLLVMAMRVYADGRPFMPALGWLWRKDVIAELLAVAVPTAVLSLLNLAAFVAITIVMANLGQAGAAAYGAIGRVEFTIMVVSFAVGVATIREVGVRFGAGDLANAKRAAWVSASFVALLLSVPVAILWFAPGLWLTLFLDDAEAIGIGSTYLSFAAPGYVAFGFGLAWLFVAQATGALKAAFLASVVRVVVIVALAFALSWAGFSPAVAAGLATALGSLFYAISMPIVQQRIFGAPIGDRLHAAAQDSIRVRS